MWPIHGQDHLLRQLEPALTQGRLAHAYLLAGPPHVGKMALALALAQAVNCLAGLGAPCGSCTQCRRIALGQHADVRVVGVGQGQDGGPTRTVIGIGDVREALRQASLKPYEGKCTVIIFDGAEAMSAEAANALLKTLEEPPPQVLLLLLTTDADSLLPTIRSRCRSLDLRPLAKHQVAAALAARPQTSPEQAERLARLSRGCLGWAFNALTDPDYLEQREAELEQVRQICQAGLEGRFSYAADLAARFSRDREPARATLYLWLRWWRDLLLVKEGVEAYVQDQERLSELRLQAAQLTTPQVVEFIKALYQSLDALERNASPRLAMEVLMLKVPAGG
ncbi:MAG: DNA polymerase III subunit delta' [SAR202 cluster bacterium]|nr:DNA polymerase III subunit delta' [SAR202 cluster bacterium]